MLEEVDEIILGVMVSSVVDVSVMVALRTWVETVVVVRLQGVNK